MARNNDGPTARILELARNSPGGVIRWCEGQAEYVKAAKFNRDWPRSMQTGYKQNLLRILKRYFDKVEGTRGYYVLRESIPQEVDSEDVKALQNFANVYGSDEYGMSTRTLAIVTYRQLARMSQVQP